MKTPRHSPFLVILVWAALDALPALAEKAPLPAKPATGLVAADNFVVPTSGSGLVESSGGSGFALPWETGGFNVRRADNFKVVSSSIPNAPVLATGGCLSVESSVNITGACRYLGQAIQYQPDNSSVWYVSVLLHPVAPIGAGGFNGFFGITLNDELFIGKPGSGALNEWVIEGRGGENQVPSGRKVQAGRTDLLVLKIDCSHNPPLALWVNPNPRQPEPAKPDASFPYLPQTIDRIGFYSTGAFMADELRVGRTLADVVPVP